MDGLIILIAIISIVVKAGRRQQDKRQQAAKRRMRSAFEDFAGELREAGQASMAELFGEPDSGKAPTRGAYRPQAAEQSSGPEPDLARQRQLKAELQRKHGSAMGRPPRQGEPGREGRSRTTAAVTGAYSEEYLGSMLYDTSEGEGHIDGDYRLEELTPRSDDHIVRPVTESDHYHAESGISAPCPPGREPEEIQDAYHQPARAKAAPVPRLGRENLRQAVLYSEILGRPRALRGRVH